MNYVHFLCQHLSPPLTHPHVCFLELGTLRSNPKPLPNPFEVPEARCVQAQGCMNLPWEKTAFKSVSAPSRTVIVLLKESQKVSVGQ